MEVISEVPELQELLKKAVGQDKKIGFVPTMGALHKGHASLVEAAREKCDIVVASIFVNPTQFNDKEDFIKYPVTTEADIDLLTRVGCDIVFLPEKDEVYPGGVQNVPEYNFGDVENIFEGAFRPGHFTGVGQVVGRLLEIVNPEVLFLGQKDYQQCIVIQQLISLLGKEDKVELVICPTIREQDGLAMSSRNRRLTEPQRSIAGTIYQCLISIKLKKGVEKFQLMKKECIDLLVNKGFEPEYLELADAKSLKPMDEFGDGAMVVLVAAKLGSTRLIDNMFV